MYAEAEGRIGHRQQVAAAILSTGRRTAGSHGSAAYLHGLPYCELPPRVTVTSEPRNPSPRDYRGLHSYAAALPPDHSCALDGVEVTTVARTLVDLARTLADRDGLIRIDGAMHACRVTREQLAEVLAGCAGWPGVRKARELVGFADPLCESPLESLARLLFHRGGLPPPETQVPLLLPYGQIARPDFLWRKQRTVVEADGMGKYVSCAVLAQEKTRQEQLEELGLIVVRVSWAQVTGRQADTIGRIQRAFGRGLG